MLEIKNLIKKYKSKGGVSVTALNDVSLKFPETGMIFLLGKSGSGKSTLLNVVGGLDRPDSGEIIIKGKNSKSFSAADFDSYRNTYIGFIFQEYNILNEFNVEQNISLALQLQGKPNDKKTVEALLEQVDLKGYGKRKPNTLSGGQKQRVAIARALIKSPEIIMADEPTGALDSNTGKQVFDTLKKLSQEKLVLVVSHDRDFAETYGDRIIELSDGKVISDVTKKLIEPVIISDNIQKVNDHTLAIKDSSKLKRSDMDAIYEVLKSQNGETIISSGERDISAVKQAIHISEDSVSSIFNDTADVSVKEYDGKKTKFIRSHLPFARAFKMGSSSLKTKPFRLIFTAFLTTVSLTMFGLSSTLMLFNENYSISRALKNSDRVSELVSKEYKITHTSYRYMTDEDKKEDLYVSYSYDPTMMSDEDIAALNKNMLGMHFAGVYMFNSSTFYLTTTGTLPGQYYMFSNPHGFVEINSETINEQQFRMEAGNVPQNELEIVLPDYLADIIKEQFEDVINNQGLVGKQVRLRLGGRKGADAVLDFTISGIVNVGNIPEKYNVLKDPDDDSISEEEKNNRMMSLRDLLSCSFHTTVYVGSDFYQKVYLPIMGEEEPTNYRVNIPAQSKDGLYLTYYRDPYFAERFDEMTSHEYGENYFNYDTAKESLKRALNFYDVTCKPTTLKEDLADNEIIIPKEDYIYSGLGHIGNSKYCQKLYDIIIDGRHYSQEIAEFFTSEKISEYTQIYQRLNEQFGRDSYPEDCDRDEDYQKAANIISQFYMDVGPRKYCLDLANEYASLYSTYGLTEDADYQKFVSDCHSITTGNPYNFTRLSDVENYLKQDKDGLVKIILLQRAINDNLLPYYGDAVGEFANMYYSGIKPTNDIIQELSSIFAKINPNMSLTYSTDHITTKMDVIPVVYYSYKGTIGTLNVVGYYEYKTGDSNGPYIITQKFADTYGVAPKYYWVSESTTDYVPTGTPKYAGALVRSNYNTEQVNLMRSNHETYRYRFSNSIYESIAIFLEIVGLLKTIFLVIGIVFGVFAALMLLNFISTSIAAKTKDIGILRAVGARGSDLFKIFFSESGLIALICLVLSIAGSITICFFMNRSMMNEVGIALLDFNLINVGIMAAGAIVIASLGTFLPVLRAALRPPVESIRTL